MDLRKITRITILSFIGLTFTVSLYFNYKYFNEEKQVKEIEKTKEIIIINKEILGQVISLDSDIIQIKDLQAGETLDVQINNETKFTKMFRSEETLNIEEADGNKENVKKDMVVIIVFQDVVENKNYIAENIKYNIENSLNGIVNSINQDKIGITFVDYSSSSLNNQDINQNKTEIKISDDTLFYQTTRKLDDGTLINKIGNLEKINPDGIKENDEIYIFYDYDLTISQEQIARKIVVIKNN